MGNILIFTEAQNGQVKKTSFELAGKAAQLAGELGGQVEAVFIGTAPENAADLGQYGVKKVTVIENPNLTQYNTGGFARVLTEFIQETNPDIVLGTASPLKRRLALPALERRFASCRHQAAVASRMKSSSCFRSLSSVPLK